MYDVLAWFNTAETLTALDQPGVADEYYQKVIDTEKIWKRWGGASALTYYAALSLQALGHSSQREEKLGILQEFAQQKFVDGSEAGFITSKPSMAVFDDDAQVENQIEGHYLMGLAQLGQGKTQEAAASFKSVLDLDPHNWWAKFQHSTLS